MVKMHKLPIGFKTFPYLCPLFMNLRDRDDVGPADGKIRLGEIKENFAEGGPL